MNTEKILEDALAVSPRDILNKRVYPGVSYWLEKGRNESVYICVDGQEPQKFTLEDVEITYGTRVYFRCRCNAMVSKIYLPHNGTSFGCRKCSGLKYFLTTFNRNSVAGKKFYKMNRTQKLINSRESMGRILYRGNYTKRFERFLKLCDRAGYESIVRGASDLMTLIKS